MSQSQMSRSQPHQRRRVWKALLRPNAWRVAVSIRRRRCQWRFSPNVAPHTCNLVQSESALACNDPFLAQPNTRAMPAVRLPVPAKTACSSNSMKREKSASLGVPQRWV